MSRDELVEAYLRGDVSRRTFIRRLTALGVSLGAAISYVDLLSPQQAAAAPAARKVYEDQLPPGAVTAAPTDVSPTGAVLHATVDPNLRSTTVAFRWGTDPAVLDRTLAAPPQEGNGDRDVAAALTGLEPATAYHVQVVATNQIATTTGAVVSFATVADAPQAVTTAVTAVTATSAMLHGTVDPDLQPTAVRFEWGPAGGPLANRLSAAQQSGDGDRDVSAPLTGLQDGRAYAARVVATNRSGEVAGTPVPFTTLDRTAPTVVVTVPAQPAAAILGAGVRVQAASPEDATVLLELFALVPKRRGGTRRVLVARDRIDVKAGVARAVRLKRTLAARGLRGTKGVRYELRTTTTDRAGNRRITTKAVRLT